MALYFRCKVCGEAHRSPIAMDKQSFATADLRANQFQCPKTRKMASYDKKDMFWREE
jgi:hypothetical protein